MCTCVIYCLFCRLHCLPHRWQGQLQQATLNGRAATVHLADVNIPRREAEQTEQATASKTLCSPSWDCFSTPNFMKTIPLQCSLTGQGRKVNLQVFFRLFSRNNSKGSLLLFMSTVPQNSESEQRIQRDYSLLYSAAIRDCKRVIMTHSCLCYV